MKKVTILIPVFNEESSFERLRNSMERVRVDNPAYEWEFLLVNDGSRDNSLSLMEELHREDPQHWSYIDLSRNYGKEVAMMAGFDYAEGDALIIMDADMQHPISVIPEMLSWWEQGYDDVYAQRRVSHERWGKKFTSKLYYRLLQKTTNIPIQLDAGDFRLLDRRCVEALREMRENERNTKGMYSWIGFRKKGIYYDQLERREGESKWSSSSLVHLALNGLTSYTTAPLRLASILGFLVAVIAVIYLIYICIRTLVMGEPVSGFPTIMVSMLFLGAVQLISLGIIGEYLARVFIEVKKRPAYFARTYNGSQAGVKK